jgi:hypothetical protein
VSAAQQRTYPGLLPEVRGRYLRSPNKQVFIHPVEYIAEHWTCWMMQTEHWDHECGECLACVAKQFRFEHDRQTEQS